MEHAQAVEQEVADAYRRTRALRLAPVLGITAQQAYERIDVTIPEREELDAALLELQSKTAAEVDAKKLELAKAQQQVAGMTDLANRLLLQAEQEVRRGESAGELAAQALTSGDLLGGDTTSAEQQLAELASVDQSGQSADLTQAMAALLGTGGPEAEEADLPSAQEIREALESEGDTPPDLTPMPPVIDENVTPLAGRKLAVGDVKPAHWLAVTDWWVIGPYDNAGRRNLDRKFDPENVVDLSAVYPNAGKNGQDLEWRFHTGWHRDTRGLGPDASQDPRPAHWVAVKPFNTEPYGIWYAYTEIEMPPLPEGQFHEVWMAFGSDDKGKVWLLDDLAGDVLIWESASHHKGWTPGEALRKVVLRPGINRILFRIENGWMDMDWSLMISAEQ
jgi:hypothetical protein